MTELTAIADSVDLNDTVVASTAGDRPESPPPVYRGSTVEDLFRAMTMVTESSAEKAVEDDELAHLGIHSYLYQKMVDLCENTEGLDIYQWCAFLSFLRHYRTFQINTIARSRKNRNICTSDHSVHRQFLRLRKELKKIKHEYRIAMLKALLCMFLQLGSGLVVITSELRVLRKDTGYCSKKSSKLGKSGLQWIIIGFVIYLSVELSSLILEIQTGGLYEGKFLYDQWKRDADKKKEEMKDMEKDFDEEKEGCAAILDCCSHDNWEDNATQNINLVPIPPFSDARWVVIGRNINYLVTVMSLFGSYIVLFNSESAVDAILNSVALLFLTSLDDELITPLNYEMMGRFLEEYRQNPKPVEDNAIQVHHAFALISAPFTVLVYVSIGLCWIMSFIVPIWVLICY